ncbi:MAG: leucine-rich repeat domain-containing protein [Lachnospiraceae bacterium]|nr:leucine-rich repeat domain-containing protein [Lachnospiraceae bacterium]
MKKINLKRVVTILISLTLVCNTQVMTVMAEEVSAPENTVSAEEDATEGDPAEAGSVEKAVVPEENIPAENEAEPCEEYEEEEFNAAMPMDPAGDEQLPEGEDLLEENEIESEQYDCNYLPNGASYELTYEELDDGTIKITGCTGDKTGELVIPDKINEKTVTVIGDYAFSNCSGFTGSLTIPNSVTTIGNFAFSGCEGFTGSLAIPNSVTTIGNHAFSYCYGITESLTIGDSVTTIGDNAFLNCRFTGNLTIPDSVTTIGGGAFNNCSGFTGTLTIGDHVNTIGISAFSGCNFTGKLMIPTSVTSIARYAFSGCSGFTGTLTIPDSVTTIGDNAFKNCKGLQKVVNRSDQECTLPISAGLTWKNTAGQEITSIRNGTAIRSDVSAYEPDPHAHYKLEYDELNDGTIRIIGWEGAPEGNLVIPDKIEGKDVTAIGDYAFDDCDGFTGSLTIGDNVKTIGKHAFYNCDSFIGSLTIPDSVTTIGNYAFGYCRGFTGSLTIPDSVTAIGDHAFHCDGFTGNLTIPDSVTTIGDSAFNRCAGFTGNLTIGESVTTIGTEAFYNCDGFTGSLTIPDSVTTIGDSAFWNCNSFTGSLTIPDSVTTIGDSAFYNCDGFTGSLTIPDSVTTIGDSAFDNCEGFTGNLTIGDSVTTIGKNAFFICKGFTGNLTIGDSVTTIGERAFYYCNGFTGSLTIPDSVTTIGGYAFYNCRGFTRGLTIGDSVTTIGDSAFWNCNGFTGSLTIPDSVLTIKDSAFGCCSSFTGNLTIPNSVTVIEDDAFYNCSGLTGILTIPDSVTAIGEDAFSDCSGFRKVVNYALQSCNLPNHDGKTWINSETGQEITSIANGTAIRSDFYDPQEGAGFTHDAVSAQTYTGKAIKPALNVYFGSTHLEEKKDYTITYVNNTNAGMAAFTITGKGNYSGKEADSFKILKKDISAGDVSFSMPATAKYTQKEQMPVPKITYNGMTLKIDKDFTICYYSDRFCSDYCLPTEPGTYYVKITGIGNYQGEKKITYVIANPKSKLMSSLKADKIKDQPYNNGNPITLDETKLVIRDGANALKKGVDYVVENADYSDNIYPGTAKVTVHGVEEKGYVGDLTLTFKITGTAINKVAIAAPGDCVYNGAEQKPEPVVAGLTKGTDYELDYEKNINAGKAKVIIKGKGGYTGSVSKTFTIKPAALTAEMISLDQADPYEYPYTGSGVKPVAAITFNGTTLKEGQDYTVKISNNSAITTASTTSRPTVTVTGKGNFAGKADKLFKIVPANLNNCQVVANAVVYKEKEGNWKTKKITVLGPDGKALKAGKDYDDKNIRYTKDEAGLNVIGDKETLGAGDTVYLTVQSKESTYTGSVTGSYTIAAQDIGKLTASLDPKTYTGKAVKLSQSDISWKSGGKAVNDVTFDFIESSYTNNVNKGKATVLVRGTGNYGGTKTITFTIGAKGILWWWRNLFN